MTTFPPLRSFYQEQKASKPPGFSATAKTSAVDGPLVLEQAPRYATDAFLSAPRNKNLSTKFRLQKM